MTALQTAVPGVGSGALVQVGELTAQVQALVLRLGKDSSNSSKPPPSDGPGRRRQTGRAAGRGWLVAEGLRPQARQAARGPGTAMQLVDDPDERIPIPALSRPVG